MGTECAVKGFDVEGLRDLIGVDQGRLALARRRQAALWRGERPDKSPILLSAPLTKDQERIPNADYKEAFEDFDRMICSQVRSACAVANARADGVPSIRVNFGTATILSCLGLEQEVYPDKMPWLQAHLGKAEISKLTADDIEPRGSFARGVEWMRSFKRLLGDACAIYCMDTQGPFDLAHLMMGDDLFIELRDDPPFVHHLLEICLELGIRCHLWMKEAVGEPVGVLHHGCDLYAENMGVRICEDTTVIVGPDDVNEYAMPYTRRLAARFGGGWVHYCGRSDHLTEAILAEPVIRGINFGHMAKFPHPFEKTMEKIKAAGKVYFGGWPRELGESGRDFLRRHHRWAEQGAILTIGNAAVGDPDGFADVFEARDFWYAL